MAHSWKKYFASRGLYSFICCFLFALSQSLLFSIYPFLAINFGVSLPELIAIFGIGSALFLFSAPGWTAVSERLGRKNILMVCMSGLAVSISALYFCADASLDSSNREVLLWFSRIIYGLTAGGVIPICQAIFSENDESELLGRFALQAQATTVGRIFGPLVGLAAMQIGLKLVFGIILLLVCITTLSGAWVAKEVVAKSSVLAAIRGITSLRRIYELIIYVGLLAMVTMSVQASLAGYFKQLIADWDMFTLTNSGIFVLGNVVMMINQRLIPKFSIRPLLVWGAAMLVLAAIGFLVAGSWYFTAMAYFLLCSGVSSLRVGLLTYFCAGNPSRKTSVIACISLLQTAGYALGSLFVAGALSYSYSFLFTGVLLVSICLCLFSLLEGRHGDVEEIFLQKRSQ